MPRADTMVMQAQTIMPSSRAYSITSVPRSSRSRRENILRTNDMASSSRFSVRPARANAPAAVHTLYHGQILRPRKQADCTSAYTFPAMEYAGDAARARYDERSGGQV